MTIREISQQRGFVLSEGGTAYAFRIGQDGRLYFNYWGAKLARDEDYFLVEAATPQEELTVFGNYDFTEPCLKVTHSDGVRDLYLHHTGHRIEGDTLTVELHDSFYPLRVEVYYRMLPGCEIIERWYSVFNEGDAPVQLEAALSAIWHLPERGTPYRLSHLTGNWGMEFQLRQDVLSEGKKTIESRRGFTSPQSNPWFALDLPHENPADEERGAVWFGALLWSGNWKFVAEVTRIRTNLSGGINDFDWNWRLDPGESFTTPKFAGGYTEGGFGQASRNLHRYQIDYVLPRNHADQALPVLYNSWEALYFNVNDDNQKQLADRAAAIGIELFVMDDGWFAEGETARNHDVAGLGDWVVNPEKFPNGLGPLIQHVHDLGMQFGLWVEPEMVNPNSQLYKAHPDWVFGWPTRELVQWRNQLVLNFANPAVEAYTFEWLDKLLTENAIDYLKWDCNRYIAHPGWYDAIEGRVKEATTRHTQALYRILDRLRQAHPKVIIESCASGGGRVDLGILQYTDQTWTSDNTDPLDRLTIQEGYSRAYAPKTMYCWASELPSPITGRTYSNSFNYQVAMLGGLGIGANLNKVDEAYLDEARQLVAQYKQIRPLVQFGDLYRLRSLSDGRNLLSWQYVSQDKSEAVVLSFLKSRFLLAIPERLYLRGLDEDALYQVEGLAAVKEPLTGSALMRLGLPLPLQHENSSHIFRLIKISSSDN